MKSKVMERSMFRKGEELDPENVGIMSGFKDMEEDMPAEMLAVMGIEDEQEDSEEDSMAKMMDRSPSSPEILMNNLRGDMRSVDARKEELADLVGYRAAADTPDEVLALLQPVLAQQGAAPAAPMGAPMPAGMPPMPPEAVGGVGALPQAEMAPPIEGAPLNMANGGIVQRFQEGSDEDGVTPAGTQAQRFYSPEMVSTAQSEILNFLAQRPAQEPSLSAQVALRKPIYQQLIGDTKDLTQAQILFDIAQGAFQYGANVDEQGRPMRGSQAARLMGAFRGVPARIGARAAEMEKQERAVSLAALQAAEKDIANIRDSNTKLVDAKRRIYSDIAKTSGDAGFGKSVKGVALNTIYQLAPQYAAGTLPPELDRKFDTAVTEYQQKERFQDPVTGNFIERAPELPQFAKDAIAGRRGLSKVAPGAATPPGASQGAPITTGAAAPGTTVAAAGAPTTDQGAGLIPTAGGVPAKGQVRPLTVWESAPDIAGPIPKAATTVARVPGLGGVAPEMQQKRNFVNAAVRDLIKNLQNNPRYAEGERKAIEAEVDIGPRFFDDAEGLRNRIVGIDDFLAKKQTEAEREGYNNELPVETRRAYRSAAQSIASFRGVLGVPIRVYSIDDVRALPPGTPFLWNGTEPRVRQ
jgi:hypothetical protein